MCSEKEEYKKGGEKKGREGGIESWGGGTKIFFSYDKSPERVGKS